MEVSGLRTRHGHFIACQCVRWTGCAPGGEEKSSAPSGNRTWVVSPGTLQDVGIASAAYLFSNSVPVYGGGGGRGVQCTVVFRKA
jgi:hypothetical protein